MHWRAPHANRRLDATVTLPGSKSMTNRALILAALAQEPTLLIRPLRSRDTLLMADALRSLGVSLEEYGDEWQVRAGDLTGDSYVDVGLAGDVMRVLPPLAALTPGDVALDRAPHAR